MIVSRIELVNWKNFHNCSVDLSERCFIVGANASGKSNFLDAFRFIHDIVKAGGGLQTAVASRGGITKIRCLAARQRTDVSISITLKDTETDLEKWKYTISFKHIGGGIVKNEVVIINEDVYKDGTLLKHRDIGCKDEDTETMKYTHLEQAITNAQYRELKEFFLSIEYLNVIPQLVRESNSSFFTVDKEDFYGRNFLNRLSKMNSRVRSSYLKKINEILKLAVPQLQDLNFVKDSMGIPHLEAKYVHWRAKGSKQQEEQFSDGTLRLIGFLFALLDSKGVILLEEPETNLHSAIVSQFPEFISHLQRSKKESRQVIITTHSYEMLANEGISGEEVVLLRPSVEGTVANNVSEITDLNEVLNAGFNVADAVIPYTRPDEVDKITLFEM